MTDAIHRTVTAEENATVCRDGDPIAGGLFPQLWPREAS